MGPVQWSRGADAGDLAARLEAEPALPEGNEERFVGYGVMAAPFRSGDLLAMRRFPASSVGPGYTSVWHRSPEGRWTFWSDRDPLEACPRYFGSALARSVVAPIEVRWPDPRHLELRVPSAELRWDLELESTRSTRLLNRLARAMPARLWQSPRGLALMARLASGLLHAGRLGLSGHVPNGQGFRVNPFVLFAIRRSSASFGTRSLGALAPLPGQIRLGDFWIPQRALFAIGRAFFEPADPARHHVVPQAG